MAKDSGVSFPFLVLIFILAIADIAKVIGKFCEKPSQMYSGVYCHAAPCDRKCIDWEKAAHGVCHLRDFKNSCYCYFNTCHKKSPPKDGSTGGSSPPKNVPLPPPKGVSPPPKGGLLPPVAGGGSPPSTGGGSPPSPPSNGGSSPPPADGGSPAPPQSETKPCPKIYRKIASLEKA